MRRATRKNSLPIAGKYAAGIHTIELPELFHVLRSSMIRNSVAKFQESSNWNGGMTWQESLDAAQFGQWTEPKIESITLPEVQAESDDVRYSYDVVGNHLDVASYISGEPEYWLTEEPIRKPCGRVIRVAVEIGGAFGVSAASMANRGQAIIALINSLELAGHSVELTIVRAYRSKGENYKFLIPVKHAGQPIDIKRLQFMIGHPSFYRRCLFGLAEVAHGETIESRSTGTESYRPDGYTHIPVHAGLSETREESLDWAQNFALTLAEN
jgi:hypothetical protein